MCERCREAQAEALRQIIGGLAMCESAGASLLADTLTAGTLSRSIPEAAEAVNQAMLDSYDTSRREAVAICAYLLPVLTEIKSRLQQESLAAEDPRPIARWSEEEQGFHISGAGPGGESVAGFYRKLPEETLAQALVRIARKIGAYREHHPS